MELKGLGWIAWILTVISWIVAHYLNRRAGLRTEVNKKIDLAIDTLFSLEDDALAYWIEESPSVYPYKLNLKMFRLVKLMQDLQKIHSKFSFPSHEVKELRQSITLDIERANRPVNAHSQRSHEISSSVHNLLNLLETRIF